LKVLFIVAGAVLIAFAPAVARAAEIGDPAPGREVAKLTASRERLRAGEGVTVSGGGCAEGSEVRFELYDPDLHSSASTSARGDGTFTQLVQVPSTGPLGRAWLRASCQTPDSELSVREVVLLVTRPAFIITWTNVLFGLGASLVTAGFAFAVLRQPQARKNRSVSARTTRDKRIARERRTVR
jgi:hypothetical protein